MSGRSPVRYVLASHAPWHRGLADRLSERTGRTFTAATTSEALMQTLAADVRYVFFAHWSARIPESIWSQYESVIFHMTDVPYGRGGSPLQNLIVRGHTDTMLSALRCAEVLDAGPVYLKKPLSLEGSADEIFRRATGVIEEMIVDIIDREIVPTAQTGEPTIFRRRTPAESELTEQMTLGQVYDHIRMLDAEGYPPAYVKLGGLCFEFSKVSREAQRLEATVTIRSIHNGSSNDD